MLLVNLKEGKALVLVLPDGREVRVEHRGAGNHSGTAVRLGVHADRDIVVLREELRDRREAPRAGA